MDKQNAPITAEQATQALHSLGRFALHELSGDIGKLLDVLERYIKQQAAVEQLGANDKPYGWLQFIDGVKTQNFARTEEELEEIKMIARVLKRPGMFEYLPVYAHPVQPVAAVSPEVPAETAQLYVFLRDSDNWCDDGDAWALLGELSGSEFDQFIRDKMKAKNHG